MFKFIAKTFIKNYDDTQNSDVRQKYGFLSGVMGIICNLILFVIKISVGFLISSVAVISDAFNNLSDMGSTLISVIGIKLSNKKPDRDHPFGHGRLEYISALVVSFIIVLVGFELLKTSFDKVLHPDAAQEINWLLIILLAFSVPVKLFMYGYNKSFGKAIDSQPLMATALDSRNDCIATGAVIISAIIDGLHILPFVIDGFVGCAVSILIMLAGFGVAKDTVALLLGTAPDDKTVKEITDLLLEVPEIIGIHDLIIHDYGPGRLFASVHAEIRDNENVVSAHEAIDGAEQKIFSLTGCEMTIHMDPISVDNPILAKIGDKINEVFDGFETKMKYHDLRMTDGKEWINIIFDILVPSDISDALEKEVLAKLKEGICSIDPRYHVVIQVDKDFVNMLQ